MVKRTGPTNKNTQLLIQLLRKEASTQKADLWKRIADDLEKPTRIRRFSPPLQKDQQRCLTSAA